MSACEYCEPYSEASVDKRDRFGTGFVVAVDAAAPCMSVECTIDHGSRSWGMRCTACGKEFEHMKPGFGWRFCPNCGAEVVDE